LAILGFRSQGSNLTKYTRTVRHNAFAAACSRACQNFILSHEVYSAHVT